MPGRTKVAAAVRARKMPLSLLIASFFVFSFCAGAQPKTPRPLKQDESCLACHGQAGMTSSTGKSISIDPAKHSVSVHGTLGCTDCHSNIKDFPHPAKRAKVQCLSCHADEASLCCREHSRRAGRGSLPILAWQSARSSCGNANRTGKVRSVPRR